MNRYLTNLLKNIFIINNYPWKVTNEISRLFSLPIVYLLFRFSGVPFPSQSKFYGIPIIQKHRKSLLLIGKGIQLRSTIRSNPLGPNHPVIISTRNEQSTITIGENFSMTGGSICSSEKIIIGNNVNLGANSVIIDTDFHPLNPVLRKLSPQNGDTSPVIIEDDVFIGMNTMILKGVTLGKGSVIGAGSVVTKSIPSNSIAAGNPAKVLKKINS